MKKETKSKARRKKEVQATAARKEMNVISFIPEKFGKSIQHQIAGQLADIADDQSAAPSTTSSIGGGSRPQAATLRRKTAQAAL